MLFFVAIAASIVALAAWSTARRQGSPSAPLALLFAVGLAFVGFAQAVVVVPAGHVGVVDLFGRVSPQTLKSGLNLVNPLARIAKMSVKTQDMKEVMDVPSQEGLTVQLEVSALYHLDPEKAADVYRTVGTEYAEILLQPQFRSVTRGVTAQYEARALYTSEREKLAEAIATELRRLVEPRGVAVEATPLRKLTLPARLAAAIEEKLGAEQESQRMQFVLAKERQEADRRRIEAQGIADFQRIVTTGINDQLLRWKGIEATLKIAESQNAKVVIVGSGKDGLPLILGGQ
jgi:prohibitin 1